MLEMSVPKSAPDTSEPNLSEQTDLTKTIACR